MEKKTIYQKLFEAKKEFTAISKDQKNPHFRSAYYDINDLLRMVEPVLHNHGLMIMQPINDGKIITQIIEVETGDLIEASFQLEYNPNPQKVGSEITYYRRYLLSSLLSLQADDDDGNKAADKKPQEKPYLNDKSDKWDSALKSIEEGKIKSLDSIKKHYRLDRNTEQVLKSYIEEVKQD